MNAVISSEIFDLQVLKKKLEETPNMDGLELVTKVTTSEEYFFGDSSAKYKVAVMDFGTKRNILNHLGCRVVICISIQLTHLLKKCLPGKRTAILSNGPRSCRHALCHRNSQKISSYQETIIWYLSGASDFCLSLWIYPL